jgi:hypothetical protein
MIHLNIYKFFCGLKIQEDLLSLPFDLIWDGYLGFQDWPSSKATPGVADLVSFDYFSTIEVWLI